MDPFPRDAPLLSSSSSSFLLLRGVVAHGYHTVLGALGEQRARGALEESWLSRSRARGLFFSPFFFFLSIRSTAQISIGGMKERKTKEADKKTRGRWWMGGGGGGGTRRGTYTWSWWMGNRSRGGRSLSRD